MDDLVFLLMYYCDCFEAWWVDYVKKNFSKGL